MHILPGTPYVRPKGYVRLHVFIRIGGVIIWYLHISHIFVHVYGNLVYSALYQVVATCSSSFGWNVCIIITAHITTNLH